MKLPYGYVLIGKEIVIHEEKADVVRSIFDDYSSAFQKRGGFSNWKSKMDEGGRG